MDFEWDEAKATSNLAKHGVAFEAVHDFDFDMAMIRIDGRRNYGEFRWQACGPIGNRLYLLVYTMRGSSLRVISLRKASDREIDGYERATEQ